VKILDYNLTDNDLLTPDDSAGRFSLWTPDHTCVVIGNGSKSELEVDDETVVADQIPVYKRRTGGCAVVLSPDMWCLSCALYGRKQIQSKDYFVLFNKAVCDAFARVGVGGLSHRGISDIALDPKKIAGTAIYRNRDLVFYHAVINVSGDIDQISRYLKQPPREPDYRAGRSHKEFVTSLREAGFTPSLEQFEIEFKKEFDRIVELLTVVYC
jgi:lipoate-protein ligase A